jgi:hypothetical protein
MSDLVWYIPLALLLLLLGALIRGHAYRTFPCFFAYVAFGVAADTTRFIMQSHPKPYFWIYWISDAGYALLGAVALYEVLRKVLRGLAGIWWTRLIFPAVAAAGIALSIWRVRQVPPQVQGHLLFWIVSAEIAVRFAQVLVFAGMVAFVPLFGLRWRQQPLGIAMGFGLYSTVALLITLKFSEFGTTFKFLWGVASLVAYSFAVLIWIWFFSFPQKEEPAPNPEQVAFALDTLNRYLEWLRRMR